MFNLQLTSVITFILLLPSIISTNAEGDTKKPDKKNELQLIVQPAPAPPLQLPQAPVKLFSHKIIPKKYQHIPQLPPCPAGLIYSMKYYQCVPKPYHPGIYYGQPLAALPAGPIPANLDVEIEPLGPPVPLDENDKDEDEKDGGEDHKHGHPSHGDDISDQNHILFALAQLVNLSLVKFDRIEVKLDLALNIVNTLSRLMVKLAPSLMAQSGASMPPMTSSMPQVPTFDNTNGDVASSILPYLLYAAQQQNMAANSGGGQLPSTEPLTSSLQTIFDQSLFDSFSKDDDGDAHAPSMFAGKSDDVEGVGQAADAAAEGTQSTSAPADSTAGEASDKNSDQTKPGGATVASNQPAKTIRWSMMDLLTQFLTGPTPQQSKDKKITIQTSDDLRKEENNLRQSIMDQLRLLLKHTQMDEDAEMAQPQAATGLDDAPMNMDDDQQQLKNAAVAAAAAAEADRKAALIKRLFEQQQQPQLN